MTITRFTPFRSSGLDVAVLQNRLNSIFQDYAQPSSSGTESLGSGSFVPPVDIYEDEQHLVLKLEVPGIPQQDLDVRVENQTLTVTGERRLESEAKEENFHRIERRFGSFVRSFTLPQTVDPDSIRATYENGILNLSIGKKAEAKPKQIKVEIGGTKSAPQVEASRPSEKAAG